MNRLIRKLNTLKPPVRWLMLFIVIMIGISILFAPHPRPIDLTEISFQTTSSSHLYFRNVRSYYYEIFEREKAPFTLYRLKRRNRDTTLPAINFMIVDNIVANEAYIFAELSQAAEDLPQPAVLLSGSGDTISLELMNSEGHYLLAAKLFTQLLENEQIHLLSRNDTVRELFSGKQERLHAETVLEDYFKLVNKN